MCEIKINKNLKKMMKGMCLFTATYKVEIDCSDRYQGELFSNWSSLSTFPLPVAIVMPLKLIKYLFLIVLFPFKKTSMQFLYVGFLVDHKDFLFNFLL